MTQLGDFRTVLVPVTLSPGLQGRALPVNPQPAIEAWDRFLPLRQQLLIQRTAWVPNGSFYRQTNFLLFVEVYFRCAADKPDT